MSNAIAMTRLASPTAAPVIAGGVSLMTTAAAAMSTGIPMELLAVTSAVGVSMLGDLVKSIPGQRQADKADETLRTLRQDMADLHVRWDRWSDQQYSFVTSMVENILSAGDAEKMEYLRRAALNVALNGAVVEVGGAFLARVIRDITGPEVTYLVLNFGKQPFLPHPNIAEDKKAANDVLDQNPNMVLVESDNDQEIVMGLQTLGILRNGPTRHSAQDLAWSATAGKVLALVRRPVVANPP